MTAIKYITTDQPQRSKTQNVDGLRLTLRVIPNLILLNKLYLT